MICLKSFLACGLAVFVSLTAKANIIGNDTANFNPNPSALDFVTVHGSDTLSPGLLSLSIFANRAKNTLPTTIDQFGVRVDPEDAVTFSDFGVAYGVSSNFEIGFVLSTLLAQEVDHSAPGAQFAATGLNDIRILSKYRFLQKEPVGAAAAVSAATVRLVTLRRARGPFQAAAVAAVIRAIQPALSEPRVRRGVFWSGTKALNQTSMV